MRQKTSDFYQRRDERCVNFFNNVLKSCLETNQNACMTRMFDQ